MLPAMFKHILIPTDGSRPANAGAKAGIRLAKALHAKLTAVHVAFAYAPRSYMPGVSPGKLRELSAQEAKKSLASVVRDAAKAGVACKTRTVVGGEPWQAIVRAARSGGCDCVVMGSHGRSGIRGLVLGSETARVLARSRIPVLVVR